MTDVEVLSRTRGAATRLGGLLMPCDRRSECPTALYQLANVGPWGAAIEYASLSTPITVAP